MSSPPLSGYDRLTLRDYWEILRLPILFALGAIALTWAIWYFTSTSCPPELAEAVRCNPSLMARYISLDALNKMVTHGVIAGGGGGFWSYLMITRERKAREALERQFTEERETLERQLAEEREEREARDRQLAEEREEREARDRQLAEEREARDRQLAEERERADAERQQLLAIIEGLNERLAERENGNNGSDSQ